MIRRHIDPLPRGGLLEILSTDSSVEGDLPAWCRLTKNEFISWMKSGSQRRYLVCKGALSERRVTPAATSPVRTAGLVTAVTIPDRFARPGTGATD
jgi:5-methyltetrahydropteroyltriglutamate--homocysteine methyltransferase